MGKYMKYEIKGTYKFILGVLALVLIFTTGIHIYFSKPRPDSLLGGTFVSISFLVIFATALTTFLYIVNSFRKELYEDRGYLTFSLPLTGNQILGAKLIVALLWFALLGIVIAIYNVMLAFNFNMSDVIYILRGIDMNYRELFILILFSAINGATTLVLIYFSMALSRVTFRNKRIGGFWFVIFLVLSGIILYGQIKVSTLLPYYLDVDTFKIISSEILEYKFNITYNNGGLLIGGGTDGTILNIPGLIYSIVIGILMFLGTGYIIENKINL